MQRPPANAAPGADGPPRKDSPSQALADVVDELRTDLKGMFPVPPPYSPRKKRAAGAGTALVLLLGAGLWWMDPTYRTETYASQIGQVLAVQLADDSQLVLDTNTRLTVQWHLRSRRVDLEQGRVHFEVTHAPLRPFLVDAGAASIRVVGTRFDVWRHQHATQVWVYQGKVAVWRNGEAAEDGVSLTQDQQTSIDRRTPEAPLTSRAFADAGQQAWRQGRLVFSDTPLDEVVATIQRYRRAPLMLVGNSLDKLTVSGVFDISNTDQLLAMLPASLPVILRRAPDGTVQIAPR